MSVSVETVFTTNYLPTISNGAVAVQTDIEPIATITYLPQSESTQVIYQTPAPVTGSDGYVTIFEVQAISTVYVKKAQATAAAKSGAVRTRGMGITGLLVFAMIAITQI